METPRPSFRAPFDGPVIEVVEQVGGGGFMVSGSGFGFAIQLRGVPYMKNLGLLGFRAF